MKAGKHAELWPEKANHKEKKEGRKAKNKEKDNFMVDNRSIKLKTFNVKELFDCHKINMRL